MNDAALREHALGMLERAEKGLLISSDEDYAAAELIKATLSASVPVAQSPSEKVATEELGEWMRIVREAIWYARVTAHSNGYALAVHGSLRRDVDVVAVPWTAVKCSPDELAEKITEWLVQIGVSFDGAWGAAQKTREEKPHGRIAWSISLKGPMSLTSRGQCAPYLDLSIMPPFPSPAESTSADVPPERARGCATKVPE